MAHVIRPDPRYRRSYLDAHDEFAGSQRDGDGEWQLEPDPSTGFAGYAFTRESLEDPETFQRYVAARRAEEYPDTPRPAHFVPCTQLWFIEGEEYLGSINLRHELTDFLLEEGGHIGYSIRPSARRRGHATEALRQTLELAAEMGYDRLLITCLEDNEPSRRVIEGAGGQYEDTRSGKRRYWVPAVAAPPAPAPVGP